MNSEKKSFTNHIKLYFLIVFLISSSFVFVSQVINDYQNDENTAQVLLTEVQETLSDSESIEQDTDLTNFFKSLAVVLLTTLVSILYRFKEIKPRLTFLFHIQPRSPPTH